MKSNMNTPVLTLETQFDLVHVGKCGGGTVRRALQAANFHFGHFHMRRPIARAEARYVILVRDPVARFVSAFNWRKHLYSTGVLPRVNTNGPLSELRHQAEREFLFLFESANALAEQLGADASSEVSPASALLSLIGHVPQGFDWYLGNLIEQIEPKQIVGIICTENLSGDFEHLFGFPPSEDQNRLNYTLGVQISEKGRANMVRECYKEYTVLHKLSLMAQSTGVPMSMRYDPVHGALPNLQSKGHIFASQNQIP